MKIPSNTLRAVIDFYKKELNAVYTESELQNIIRWVLQKQLGLSAYQIIAPGQIRVNESDLIPLEKMCYELKQHKPLQYVLGEAEFYRLAFKVNENVLIPRPETEELVDLIIKEHKKSPGPLHILDIGTGSGCIPVSVKKNMPQGSVYALDISEEAIHIAYYNARQNHAEIFFFNTDILSAQAAAEIKKQTGQNHFNIIVSNPPYIPMAEKGSLHPRVVHYEPHKALFVEGGSPLLFYEKITELGKEILTPGGYIYLECHSVYAPQTAELFRNSGYGNVEIIPDMAGLNRFVRARL